MMTAGHRCRIAGACMMGIVIASLHLAGCGCGKRETKYCAADRLRQVRLRFSKEKRKRTCYVVAEIENPGELPVREAKVTATLLSKTGKQRGVNHAFIRDIRPGEKRTLYMTITTHGGFHRVELSFHEPNGED